jgi:hypothetical protein
VTLGQCNRLPARPAPGAQFEQRRALAAGKFDGGGDVGSAGVDPEHRRQQREHGDRIQRTHGYPTPATRTNAPPSHPATAAVVDPSQFVGLVNWMRGVIGTRNVALTQPNRIGRAISNKPGR